MLADEFHLSGTFPTRNEVDRREMDVRNGTLLGRVPLSAPGPRGYQETPRSAWPNIFPNDPRIAEMWNLNGYVNLFFAQDYCSGVPFSETPNEGEIVFGETADHVGDPCSGCGQLRRGGNGRWRRCEPEAPRSDRSRPHPPPPGRLRRCGERGPPRCRPNGAYYVREQGRRHLGTAQRRLRTLPAPAPVVALRHGGRERHRVSLGRPTCACRGRTAASSGFDEETPLYHQAQVRLRGVRCRSRKRRGGAAHHGRSRTERRRGLARKAERASGRRWAAGVADPGDPDGRVRMLFGERARWLFGTGQRLGDLRRLVRQYGYDQSAVFPTGTYAKGGTYGMDVNFPIPFEEHENQALSGLEGQPLCLDRNA